MSKQVIRKGDTIQVRTSEDYQTASKIIFLKKGKTAKVFYPYTPVIYSIEDAESCTICGYRASELVKLALQLRERGVSEIDLRANNDTYMAGYQRAYEEINKQIEASFRQTIDNILKDRETILGADKVIDKGSK